MVQRDHDGVVQAELPKELKPSKQVNLGAHKVENIRDFLQP